MDTERLTEVLQKADLSPYQADAYVRLLELGTASATEVADASDVPDARIYDVLRDLDDQGYIELYEQDTLRARAVDPESAIEELTERANQFEAAAEEIRDRHQRPAMDSHTVSIVKRFETLIDASKRFIEEADTQIHAGLTPEQFRELRDPLASAYEDGVTVNVSLLENRSSRSTAADVEAFAQVCSEMRRRPSPSPFVVAVDLERTTFASNPAVPEEYGIVLENRSFSYVFYWYFLSFLWTPWTAEYSEVGEQTPMHYADVRQFLLDFGPFLEAGATIDVEVEGRDVDAGRVVQYAGTVVDVEREADLPGELDSELLELSGTASIAVETTEGIYTVGGWGAAFEDVEARRITVTDLDLPDEP